jgi:anthranilate phosphoribosyltransferase
MIETQQALNRLLDGGDLTRQEMEELFGRLMDGLIPDPVKAALLVALRMKGETAPEIAGAASAMRARAVRIPHRRERVVDTCGTGGDQRGTFNISTAAALVAAAGGVPVAKHGNRSVSSRSGSADVLAALGVDIEVPPAVAGRALDEVGIAFLFAPLLHPAMREVMPVRKTLGVRTVFNVLGPLTNPAGARRQVMGVYAEGLTLVGEVRGGEVEVYELAPERFGVARAELRDLAGGDPEENAAAMERVLGGEAGALADVVALNAGAALFVGGVVAGMEAGVERARELLESGAGMETLEALRGFGRQG